MIRKSISFVAALFVAVFLFGFQSVSHAQTVSDQSTANYQVYAYSTAGLNGTPLLSTAVRVTFSGGVLYSSSFRVGGAGWSTVGVANSQTLSTDANGNITTTTSGFVSYTAGGTTIRGCVQTFVASQSASGAPLGEAVSVVGPSGQVLYSTGANGSLALLPILTGSEIISLY